MNLKKTVIDSRRIWDLVDVKHTRRESRMGFYSLFLCILGTLTVFLQSIKVINNLRICRTCKVQYEISVNEIYPTCRYHTGKWIGAELSKHFGTKSGDIHTGLALFWDCCDAEDVNDKGCKVGFHKSYDDDDVNDQTKYFVNRK